MAAGATGAVARAAAIAELGLRGALSDDDVARVRSALSDDADPRVRAAAVGALVRGGGDHAGAGACRLGFGDPDPAVRRRAAELVPAVGDDAAALVTPLVALLGDRDVAVVESAAWALGELGDAAATGGAVEHLAVTARSHRDPVAREAAIGALGALGDRDGLAAILDACTDRPAVRRRAVLALAPFDGPDVDAALARAATDHDWQVRQAAEDLTGHSS